MLLFALVLLGVLAGAAVHTSMPVFLLAAGAIGAWLLLFGAREHLPRLRRH